MVTHIIQIEQRFFKKTARRKTSESSLAVSYELINHASNTDLAQGTVGLLIEEFDLICSRAGLFVRKTPGDLREEVTG